MGKRVKSESPSFRSRLCHTLVAESLKKVETELADVKAVRFLCDYPWIAGKRLRPIVFLLSNLSVRVERSSQVALNGRESQMAAAIELLHEASLIHDDLVDRSEVRRGKPTIQMVNGQGLALLIGDYMVFRGLKLILDAAETKTDIVLAQELANTGLSIAHGEVDQLDRYLKQQQWTERASMATYLELIAKKTAAFFAGCAEAGAALGGADATIRKIYREFGMNMGIVFQMMDDLIDIFGDPKTAKKSLQNNVSEGTVTLPMIHAWELYPDDPDLCRLARGGPLDKDLNEKVYRRFASEQVLCRSRQTIQIYTEKAAECLRQMPLNIYRMGLMDLLDYIKDCSWGGLDSRTKLNGRENRG
jgi:geranylgeranyl pyrophosphate synthase